MDLDNIQRKYGLLAPLPVVQNGKFATRFPLNLEHRGDDVFQFGGKYIGEIENIYDLLYKILTNQEIDASLALPYAIKITEDKLYVRDKTNSEWILIFDITKPNFPKEIELYELIYKAITHQVIGEDTSYPGQFKIEENILYVRDKDNLTWTQIGDVTKEFLGATEATQAILEQVNDILTEVQELKTELNRQIATTNETLTTALQAANEAMISAQSINIRTFVNVEEMKASNTLKAGALAKTLGFYEANDGGGADYVIVNSVEKEPTAIQLQNGLCALMLKPNLIINFKQVGGKTGEGENNNSELLQNLINFFTKKKVTIFFDDKFYFYTPIYCENITGITFKGTDRYSSNIRYKGDGYFLSCNIMHSVNFEKLVLAGNKNNYGISTGNSTTYLTNFVDVTFTNFKGHLAINSSAYVYLHRVTFNYFDGDDVVEFFVRLGKPEENTNMELVFMDNCIFDASSTSYYNCDLLQIYNMATLRCTDCDFANTSGHWVYMNNTGGSIYDAVFTRCSFTRSKKGIGIKPTSISNIYRISLKDCAFSLNGTWEDGEENIIYVDDSEDVKGMLSSVYISNIYVQRLSEQYTPDYFFNGGTKNNVVNIDISFKRPNTPNKFLVSGIDTNEISVTKGEKILQTSNIEIVKVFNNLIVFGSFQTTEQINLYTTIFTIDQNMFLYGKSKCIDFVAYTDSGDIYPLYIEGTECKTRKTIPANAYLRFYVTTCAV